MIRHIGAVIRVIGRLDFPGHDSLLNEDFPGTRTGTVHAMRGTDHFIVLPAIAIKLFPGTRGVILGAEVAKIGKGISHFFVLLKVPALRAATSRLTRAGTDGGGFQAISWPYASCRAS